MIGKAKWTGWLSLALGLGLGGEGRGQGLLPPAPGVDLQQVSRQMAEALRELAEDVAAGVGGSPGGRYLVGDCRELERSTREWFEATRRSADPHQIRRSYSGIDVGWHRLRGRLAAPGLANPAIGEEIGRVDQADAAIHQALRLNAYPAALEGATAAPSGLDETRRLAYSVAQRGEALASQVQAVFGPNPATANLAFDAADIARIADAFSDSFGNPAGIPPIDQARQSFEALFQRSVGLGMNLDRALMPPDVRANWLAYATALNLARDNLGLSNASTGPASQPAAVAGFAYNPNPAPQVAQWADGLDRQVDDLIGNFGPTAGVVPEGREMLGEMERLRDEVRRFRGDAARGLDPGRLAYEFRDVDATWQRLARQVNRIARGRTGPNIQRLQQIGQTCEQIHRVLGMPGYPPIIQP